MLGSIIAVVIVTIVFAVIRDSVNELRWKVVESERNIVQLKTVNRNIIIELERLKGLLGE